MPQPGDPWVLRRTRGLWESNSSWGSLRICLERPNSPHSSDRNATAAPGLPAGPGRWPPQVTGNQIWGETEAGGRRNRRGISLLGELPRGGSWGKFFLIDNSQKNKNKSAQGIAM